MVDALDFRRPSREEISMKQHWGTDELVEHWTLLPRETELLRGCTRHAAIDIGYRIAREPSDGNGWPLASPAAVSAS